MNLASTISIYSGGPGSGCQGENCGRPSNFSDVLKKYGFEGPKPSPEARRAPDKYKKFRSDARPPKPYTNHINGKDRIRVFPDSGWKHDRFGDDEESLTRLGEGIGWDTLQSHLASLKK